MKKHYKYMALSMGGVALVGSVGAAIGVPLYMKSKYEDALGNFIDRGSTVPNYQKDKKITYVALGDSITAGYNGFFHSSDQAPDSKDYISYADFLAKDLQNAGLLNDYKNYAKSGDTIWDTNELLDESQSVNYAIKGADLITVSVSSNDLLGALTALGFPFATNLNAIMGNVQLPNHLRDALFNGLSPNKGIGGSATTKLIADALKKGADLLYKGKTQGVFDVRDSYKDVIFGIIKRGLMILTRDLHQAAPKAHIKFIMPEFPLIGISKSLETENMPNIGKSMVDYFNNDFMNAVREGISAQYTSMDQFHDAFTEYATNIDKNTAALKIKLDKLQKTFDVQQKRMDEALYISSKLSNGAYPKPKGFTWTRPAVTDIKDNQVKIRSLSQAQLKSIGFSTALLDELKIDNTKTIAEAAEATLTQSNITKKLLKTYQDHYDQMSGVAGRYIGVTDDKVRTIISNELMPDFADIHPSTRGHQVMGSYLFKELLPMLSSSNSQPAEELYQFAVPYEDDGEIKAFEELDQIDWNHSKINKELHLINKDIDGSTVSTISRAINKIITQHPHGLSSPLKELLNIINPLLNGQKAVSTNVYKLIIDDKGGNADELYGVKGATPGFDAQSFIGQVSKGSSSTKEEVNSDDTIFVTIASLLTQELVISPDAAQNIKDLHNALEAFDMKNNFTPDASAGSSGGTALTEVFKSNGMTKTGDYPGSTPIDWSKVPATNEIKKQLEANTYLKAHIITLEDLLTSLDHSRLLDLIKVFLRQKISAFLSDDFTKDFSDLPSISERAIALAKEWGCDELAKQLGQSSILGDQLDKLLHTFAEGARKENGDHDISMSYKSLKGALSMGVSTLYAAVKDASQKATAALIKTPDPDPVKQKALIAQYAQELKDIDDAYAAYTKAAASAANPANINSGFEAFFKIINM